MVNKEEAYVINKINTENVIKSLELKLVRDRGKECIWKTKFYEKFSKFYGTFRCYYKASFPLKKMK